MPDSSCVWLMSLREARVSDCPSWKISFFLVLVSALRFDSCLRFFTFTPLWFSLTAPLRILVRAMRHKVDRKDFFCGGRWGRRGSKILTEKSAISILLCKSLSFSFKLLELFFFFLFVISILLVLESFF